MLRSIKRHKDGTVTETVRKLTKRIRAIDGSFRTMVSFDGQSWIWDQREQVLARSLQSAQNLQGKQWTKAKIQEFDAKLNPGVQTEAWLNPVPKHGSPILGKAKGKAQKFRKNLRRKKEKLVKVAKAVHFHTCPFENHPYGRRRFSCSCERPEARHIYCGGSKCMFSESEVVLIGK